MMMHIQRGGPPSIDSNINKVSLDEVSNTSPAFLLFNALTTIGVVYLAAYTGLNRWRALQEYDRVVKSPDSSLALKSVPALMAPQDAKKVKRNRLFLMIALGVSLLLVLGSFISAGVKHTWDDLFDETTFYVSLFYFACGFSALDHTLPTTVEGLLRFISKDNWEPLFIIMPRRKWQNIVAGVAYTSLGAYTAFSTNGWLATTAVAGMIFHCTSRPYASNMHISVRGAVLALFGFILAFSCVVGAVLNIGTDNESSDSGRSGGLTLSHYVGTQYSTHFAAILSTLVLRAEWTAAQKAADTRARARFDVYLAEKDTLLEKVPEELERSTVETSTDSSATAIASTTSTTQTPVKARAIRVPPIDLFHLNKNAAKAVGKLEPFAAPVFNTLLLAALLTHLPGILFSASKSSLSPFMPFSSTFTWLANEYMLIDWAWRFPAQYWGLLVQPTVLVVVLTMRWNKGGREIWVYGERWSKELPKLEQLHALTATSSEAGSQSEPLLSSELA